MSDRYSGKLRPMSESLCKGYPFYYFAAIFGDNPDRLHTIVRPLYRYSIIGHSISVKV